MMNFHFTLVCLATLLIRSSFEENNASTKKKKYNPDQNSECPKACRCSTVVTQHTDFLKLTLPKILRTVNCTKRSILKIPSRIPSNTQSLILFDNYIKDAHRTVPEMTDLVYLDLSRNKIQNLGRGMIFKRLKKLKILDLSENSFKVLFAKVFSGLTSLEELRICRTKLVYIDEFAFERLYRLTHLYLRSNQLVNIFLEWFQDMDRLKVLDLSYNHVKFVSADSFMHLSTLFELDLQGNGIKGFSNSALNGLSYLKKLKLGQNNLTVVPQRALKSLTGLKELDLSENPIEKISQNDFGNCTLEVVKINLMPRLRLISSKSFSHLPNLTRVELNNNTKLMFIDASAFYDVNQRLKSVDIKNGGLQVLLSAMTSAFSSETLLDVTNNPLRCDCNVKWLISALEQTTISTMVQIANSSELLCYKSIDDVGIRLFDLKSENISDECPARAIRLSEAEEKVEPRKSTTLECRATGMPRPDISWISPDGRELNSSTPHDRISVLEDGCLQFDYTVRRDEGEYICCATNDYGRSMVNMTLKIMPIDLGIHVNRVSATFVSVIWNGTARSAYNTYKLLCKEQTTKTSSSDDYIVVPVSPFDRAYTISNLKPSRPYLICIAIEDGLPADKLEDQIVACMNVTTFDVNVILSHVSEGHSNIAIGVSLGIGAMTVIVLCLAYMAAKKYRHAKYKDPDEDRDKVNNVSQIQLETLYSPLISHVGQQNP